ncbi:uncharacterized protein [Littorina saxatilis]|uniref:Uncharacterized protein n=1 Tax=Littorina saxatilis TaxID=31220 RepID=A0AAN9BIC3_9CAEN
MSVLHFIRLKTGCSRLRVCTVAALLTLSAYYFMYLNVQHGEKPPTSFVPTNIIDSSSYQSRPNLQKRQRTSQEIDHRTISHAQNQNACRIPDYHPFDPDAMKFMEKWPPFPCHDNEALLTRVEGGVTLVVNTELVASWKEKIVNCSFQAINRLSESKVKLSDPRVFKARVDIDTVTDGIRVRCYLRNSKRKERLYENFHFIMMEKPEIEKLLQTRMRGHQRRSSAPDKENKLGRSIPAHMSVLIVGVDSVSRFNMIRSMSRTRHFLLNRMGAIEFSNYGKVGENTFPNVFAMLTGTTPEKVGWNLMENMDRQGFRFLWEDFADEGFRTLFDEEDPYSNMFTYAKKGFVDQPTHYYARTVETAKEDSKLFSHHGSCFKGVANDLILMNHVKEFCRLFRHNPYFAILWLSPSTHDQLNGGSRVDGYHEKFLSELLKEQLLNNTLLVFMSDHGIRFGDFRNTPMGKFEEMRPFLFLVFPEWFIQAYPHLMDNVKNNAARMTTPLDLHFTLRDVLFLNNVDNSNYIGEHGISFFKKIPENRTCVDAGIPLPYCVCLTERPLLLHSPIALKAGIALVKALNTALTEANVTDVCHTLKLSGLVKVMKLEGGGMYMKSFCNGQNVNRRENAQNWLKMYRVTVVVTPNEALLEGYLVKCGNSMDFQLRGDVSRLNYYGNTSHCVDDPFFKKICYCKEHI